MILVSNNHPSLQVPRREISRTIRSVLGSESSSPFTLSVIFVNNRFIRNVNKKFLQHDYVTDVIAFPLNDGEGIDAEVYVNLDKARSQAREFGVSFLEETRRLLIHGALHLVGYNDTNAEDRRLMRAREEFFLARLSTRKA